MHYPLSGAKHRITQGIVFIPLHEKKYSYAEQLAKAALLAMMVVANACDDDDDKDLSQQDQNFVTMASYGIGPK